MPNSETLLVVFMVLCAVQFLFPLLASKIKARFRDLGYEMKAEPIWSLLNVTQFWSEAREHNRHYKDPAIFKLLLLRTVWWVLVGAAFIGLATSDGW
jgi:uncharacterized membrane protein YhaH (DUF805 family)